MRLYPSSIGRSSRQRFLSGSEVRRLSLYAAFVALVSLLSLACTIDERQSGIPDKAQETINSFTADFNEGRFEKIYREAAEEWRARVTLEQSNETFRRLKERLGTPHERTYTSGKQQPNPAGAPSGSSLVIRYNTKFRLADGSENDALESITLIERDGRYQLAGYSVNSNLLKQ
jgi:hypothetical protein